MKCPYCRVIIKPHVIRIDKRLIEGVMIWFLVCKICDTVISSLLSPLTTGLQ